MSVRNNLLERSKQLLKRFWGSLLPRRPQLSDIHTRAREILETYPGLSERSIWELADEVETLKGTRSPSAQTTQRLEDLEELMRLTLGMQALNLEPMNAEYREDQSTLDGQSRYSPERFPRDWFLDYVALTPKFGVGDILYKIDYDSDDGTTGVISEVVVTCVISDIFEISYYVASHDLNNPMCESQFHEVEEARLAFRREELDPRRKRLEVVKT